MCGTARYAAAGGCAQAHQAERQNQTLWLRLDLPELREATLDNLDEKAWVFSKKFAEPGFLLPPDPIRMAKIKEGRQTQVQYNKMN